MLEKFYDNSIDDWVSVTMINGEIMYGYRKRKTKLVEMSNGITKVYDANEIGGEVDRCEVPLSCKEEVLKAYRAIGAEVIGFDMIFNGDRPIIIDENTFPGYYEDIFQEVGRDPAAEFYKLIISEINKIRHK
jgi:glutathione synthase/RimK-type ligase-like ATP-grasp enzyme